MEKLMSIYHKRIVWPLGAGIAATIFLAGVYLSIMTVAEGPQIALDLFWADRSLIIPILLGFGIQAALYTILRKRLFLPVSSVVHTGKLMGARGATSTFAMIACCAHHVTDILPILGLSAVATVLGQYRTLFLYISLATTGIGIAVMLLVLLQERQRVLQLMSSPMEAV
jgi:hypothetical protein